VANLKESSLVGKMQQLYIGSEYNVTAKLLYNSKYKSWQYEPINIAAIVPKTEEQQRIFLKSLVTERQANILLSAYPNIVEDTINGKMENIDLDKTNGIKEYTWGFIKEKIINNYVISDILCLLQPLGVTYTMIKKLLMNYGNTSLLKEKLLEDPYILIKIHGLGFKRVDGLALKLKPELIKSHKRIYAFINYYLKELGEQNGHTWITFDMLENAIRDNISECEELYYEILDIERKTKAFLYIDDDKKRIGLKYYRDIEINIYSILRELDGFENKWELDVEQGIKEAEEELGFELSDEQKEVIREAVKHNVTIISGKAGCVDCDTEFFNGFTWKKISEYQPGDKVLQYNKDGIAELVYPINYIKEPCEYLNLIQNRSGSFNQCLSDEHRFLYFDSNNQIKLEPFYQIKEKHSNSKLGFWGKIPTTFAYNGNGINLTDDQIRVMIAVIADGWFGSNTNRCRIKVKKERKINRLKELLRKANIQYEETFSKGGYSNFWFNAPLREKVYNDNWYNCSQSQLQIVVDECLHWDGSIEKNNKQFYTSIKQSADFIQFAFSSCGYKSNIITYNRIGEKRIINNKEYTRKTLLYSVNINKNKTASMRNKKGEKIEIKNYKTIDGYKYCFTVPSGMLVLRRNDRIFITGNSGKTTISRALLKIYKNANKVIGAAALSAKAAQRITEATGFRASTIHRMLGAKGFNDFEYNHQNPLPYDVVLADEGSMNNARIMYDLVSALKPGAKLIISGDCRQLPPIGFGNVFSDLLELKNRFHVFELTKVHRQAEKSGILTDANMIREGINPIQQPELKIVHGELQDMYYMFRDNRDALHEIAINMFLKSIETDTVDEVIVITPRKKDCINSTREINIKIQDALIDNNQPYLTRGKLKFKLGAKVMQITNNYGKNIFNGDIGYIKQIDNENGNFVIEYPTKVVLYSRSELDQIDLAYCLTIHKCQGSGYKTVIAIIDNTHYALLDSCLLYTALTRAKKRCLLLAEPSAFKKCINQNSSIARQTWFKELNDEIVGFKTTITLDLEEGYTEEEVDISID
jgi:hypothetical protein